ncbi:MAG: glutamate-5-semialdehyde dehydrogenase [Kiritimatiellae bacterium]|nr:glutamate-5-semialdehyde dehydrogenase [Kiritimatiellia bacterium]
MTISETIQAMAVKARAAAAELRMLTTAEKNAILLAIAAALESEKGAIQAANAADVAAAQAAGLAAALVDRLTLTDARFAAMVEGVRHVASLPDPVGEVIWTRTRPSGITIRKTREPFGVVAVVFESRPNVFVDTAALCLKTGNAIILRGGKEAVKSNAALARVVRAALAGRSPAITASSPAITASCSASPASSPAITAAVQFVEVQDHAAVAELVRAVGLIDVAIPRGGERLIRAMCEAALIPVLKHYKGVCHVYVDDKADLGMALTILDNAKVQRPSACNAAECLLVHERLAPLFLPMVRAWAKDRGVTLHDDGAGVEYLSLDLNVATVPDVRAAIDYVNAHGSHHSDAIVTNDAARAAAFLRDVDSACVYHNVSTRFTDGAEFGMGAEIGISTDKLHARGPMGLEELTTYKYAVTGDGVIRKG